jgi:DNA-binding transcriptional LysR family regulator
MQPLDPRHITAFLAILRAGSLRGAAEQLGVEASTISRSLAAMERQLGTSLFERGRSGARLTEAGALLQEHLGREASALELMQSRFDALRGLQRGKVTLAVGEGFVSDLFSSALADFASAYPKLTYSVSLGSTDEVAHLIASDEAHLGFAYNLTPDQRFKSIAQATRPLVMLAGAGTTFATLPGPISLTTAASLPAALLSQGSGVGAMLTATEARHGLRLRALVETRSIAVLKAFLHAGMGVTFLPRFVLRREIDEGSITETPLHGQGFGTGAAHLFARTGRELPQAAQLLARHLAKAMSAFTD